MDFKNKIFKYIIYGGLFFSLAGNAVCYYSSRNLRRELDKANDRVSEILNFSREFDCKKNLLEEQIKAIDSEKNNLEEKNLELEMENYELRNWNSLLQMAYDGKGLKTDKQEKKIAEPEKRVNRKVGTEDKNKK